MPSVQFSSVQSLNRVRLFATPRTAAHQASLSITTYRSLLKLMPIESVMPSNHLILHPPLLLPSIFPSIGVFSNESALHIRWPKYWSLSFSISPSSEYSDLLHKSFLTDPICYSCFPLICEAQTAALRWYCLSSACFSFWLTSLCIIGSP